MDGLEKNITSNLDYKNFIKIIKNIPSCIFYKDKNLRYMFSTKYWEQLNGENIFGKTDIEIRKDKENAIFAMETDKNILRTGKGCKYIVKSKINDKISYLEIIKEPVLDNKGEVIGIVGLINDVTEKTIIENKLRELNTIDTLTKLYNRQTGTDTITAILEGEKRDNKAFCLIDINNFKGINDTYGHQVGDAVLQEFGLALKNSLLTSDIAMRLGGDEFIVLLNNISNKEQIITFIHKLYENISKIKIKELDNPITISIGVAKITDKDTFDSLYYVTDKNMYKAKKNKHIKGNYYIISE